MKKGYRSCWGTGEIKTDLRGYFSFLCQNCLTSSDDLRNRSMPVGFRGPSCTGFQWRVLQGWPRIHGGIGTPTAGPILPLAQQTLLFTGHCSKGLEVDFEAVLRPKCVAHADSAKSAHPVSYKRLCGVCADRIQLECAVLESVVPECVVLGKVLLKCVPWRAVFHLFTFPGMTATLLFPPHFITYFGKMPFRLISKWSLVTKLLCCPCVSKTTALFAGKLSHKEDPISTFP